MNTEELNINTNWNQGDQTIYLQEMVAEHTQSYARGYFEEKRAHWARINLLRNQPAPTIIELAHNTIPPQATGLEYIKAPQEFIQGHVRQRTYPHQEDRLEGRGAE
ncbi:hypothetical protein [Absidia glauca]|uniref:Uncharacterized protein n=1 Tax=Absidia glauca TaxID=4829 RepID=A0A168R800_ABSGL|nr:hypothetical protein [Absidia glauca]